MVYTFGLADIDNIAHQFLKDIGDKKVIALHGTMGAGKTTFSQAVCKALQVTSPFSSPTFSIINQYTTEQNDTIYHIDLYRLKSDKEAVNAGVEDCLYSGNFCLVEWPEIAPAIFPEDTLHVYISLAANNERKLEFNL
jgi:tRNA threonylcarbamoyladenosine biosynthesis protein TsaE